MSVFASAAVWRNSQAEGGDLLVLLALADFADENFECYPSVSQLAEMSRLSTRQVQRCVGRLVELGDVEIVGDRIGGRGRATTYRIAVEKADNMSPLSGAKGRHRRRERATPTTVKGDTDVTPTVKNRQEPLEKRAAAARERAPAALELVDERDEMRAAADAGETRIGDGFESFWKAYPRTRGKKAAHTAYSRCLRRNASLNVERLRRSVENFAAVVERDGVEEQFVPYAQRWLNEDRWQDFETMPEPASRKNGRRKSFDDLVDEARERRNGNG